MLVAEGGMRIANELKVAIDPPQIRPREAQVAVLHSSVVRFVEYGIGDVGIAGVAQATRSPREGMLRPRRTRHPTSPASIDYPDNWPIDRGVVAAGTPIEARC